MLWLEGSGRRRVMRRKKDEVEEGRGRCRVGRGDGRVDRLLDSTREDQDRC
jgi:hypothetical protein